MKIQFQICIAIIMLIIPFSVSFGENKSELINKWARDHLHDLTAHRLVISDNAWENKKVVSFSLSDNNMLAIILKTVRKNQPGNSYRFEVSVDEYVFDLKFIESFLINDPRDMYFMSSKICKKEGKNLNVFLSKDGFFNMREVSLVQNSSGEFLLNNKKIQEKPKETLEDLSKYCMDVFNNGNIVSRTYRGFICIPISNGLLASQLKDLLEKRAKESQARIKTDNQYIPLNK